MSRICAKQAGAAHGRVGNRAHPLREIRQTVAGIGAGPGVVEDELAMRVRLAIPRRGSDQAVAFPEREVAGCPAQGCLQAAVLLEPLEERMRQERVASIVKTVACVCLDSPEIGQELDALHANKLAVVARHACPTLASAGNGRSSRAGLFCLSPEVRPQQRVGIRTVQAVNAEGRLAA